jgi:omega-amidase
LKLIERMSVLSITVACLQFDIEFGNPEKNFNNVEAQFAELFKGNSVDIVVLPELWTTGYDLTRLDKIADENGTDTKKRMSTLAQKYNTNIVAGSVAKKLDGGVTNTSYYFDRKGNCVGEYSKVHLFKLMDEHLHLEAGETKGTFEFDGERFAGFICYDIRFPEWMRTHTTEGAKVIFVVAEWPEPRLAHWRSLLISRAIENQCYVVACNRSGKDPNNEFVGNSIVVDPWGEIIAEADKESTILKAELNLDKVDKVRKQIPIFQDRRPDLY